MVSVSKRRAGLCERCQNGINWIGDMLEESLMDFIQYCLDLGLLEEENIPSEFISEDHVTEENEPLLSKMERGDLESTYIHPSKPSQIREKQGLSRPQNVQRRSHVVSSKKPMDWELL